METKCYCISYVAIRISTPPINATSPYFRNGDLWGIEKINAPSAWDVGTGSKDVVVCVIDTGVDYNHQDLADNMWRNPGETGLDSQGRDKATNGVDDDGNGVIDGEFRGWEVDIFQRS